jgi:hypothetical protein
MLCLGLQGTFASAAENDLRIANVTHNGIHFFVAIDPHNNRFLEIVVPEKDTVQPRPIRISLRFRDESKIEGAPEQENGAISNGGYTDWRYHLDAKRPLVISDIFSVTIWVGDEMFVVAPW